MSETPYDVRYPLTFPQRPSRLGPHSYALQEYAETFQPDHGPSVTWRADDSGSSTGTWLYLVRGATAARAFETFWRDDVEGGARLVGMEHPMYPDEMVTTRWTAAPSVRSVGGTLYLVELSMEIFD